MSASPDRAPDLRTISLGAGVQSTTLYLMAVRGEIGPKPDAAIFADTQAEPPWVYEHLDRLERDHGASLPIHRVTIGDIVEFSFRKGGEGRRSPRPPVFLRGKDGKAGMMPRQCTQTFKVEPFERAAKNLLGLKPRQRFAGRYTVEVWIGISTDEAHRMKPARTQGFVSRWPLIERRMSRGDCMNWLRRSAFDVPGKSACYFCPFHSNRTWLNLKRNAPETFELAAIYDDRLRTDRLNGVVGVPFLHRSLRPLREVDLNENQLELGDDGWGNECEGRCGV